MQVNELIEFLEYCSPTATVSVGIEQDGGQILACRDLCFLAESDRVYVILDTGPNAPGSAPGGLEASGIAMSDYERPQIFGKQLILVKRQAQKNGTP
jgi:hypothetical protein